MPNKLVNSTQNICGKAGTVDAVLQEFKWGNSLWNPEKNVQQSIGFMKQLTVIALSNITYLRNIFPESAYRTRYLSGMPLRILHKDNNLPLVQKMMSNIKATLEVLSMKYLHKMMFVIEDLESGDKEVYTLNFKYNNCDITNENGETLICPQSNNTSDEEIKKQTQDLIRKLCVMISTKEFLSKKISMHFRLQLNEDVPEDFQLQHFYHCDEIPYIDFPDGFSKIKLGKVVTPYHALTTNYHTYQEPINKDDSTVNENQQSVDKTINLIEDDSTVNENQQSVDKTIKLIEDDSTVNENQQSVDESLNLTEDDSTVNEDQQSVDDSLNLTEHDATYNERWLNKDQSLSQIENVMMSQDLFENYKPSISRKRSSTIMRKIVEGGPKKRQLRC